MRESLNVFQFPIVFTENDALGSSEPPLKAVNKLDAWQAGDTRS